jgi:hypothetical protein
VAAGESVVGEVTGLDLFGEAVRIDERPSGGSWTSAGGTTSSGTFVASG